MVSRKCGSVTYDVTIPFIRMVAGTLDYTQGAMRNATKNNYRPVNSEAMSQGTRCRQLAQYVVFESPLNMLCDSPSNYLAEPELYGVYRGDSHHMGRDGGTEWRDCQILTLARRKGDVWYVGSMTNWDARSMELDCRSWEKAITRPRSSRMA